MPGPLPLLLLLLFSLSVLWPSPGLLFAAAQYNYNPPPPPPLPPPPPSPPPPPPVGNNFISTDNSAFDAYIQAEQVLSSDLSDVDDLSDSDATGLPQMTFPQPQYSGGYGMPAEFNGSRATSESISAKLCFTDPLFSPTNFSSERFPDVYNRGYDAVTEGFMSALPKSGGSDCNVELYKHTQTKNGGIQPSPGTETCICGSVPPEITGQRLTGNAATDNGNIVTNGVCDRVEIGWAWPAGSAVDTECDNPEQRDDRCLNPIVLGLYSAFPDLSGHTGSSSSFFSNAVGDDFQQDGGWAFIVQDKTPRSEEIIDGFLDVGSRCGTVFEDPLAGDQVSGGTEAAHVYRLPSAVPSGLYCEAAGASSSGSGLLNLGSTPPGPPPPASPASPASPPPASWFSRATTAPTPSAQTESDSDATPAYSSRLDERGWAGLDIENNARFDADCQCRGGLLENIFTHAGVFFNSSYLFPYINDSTTDFSTPDHIDLDPQTLNRGEISAWLNGVLNYTNKSELESTFSGRLENYTSYFSNWNDASSIAGLLRYGHTSRQLKACSASYVVAGQLYALSKLYEGTGNSLVENAHNLLQESDSAEQSSTLALQQVAVEAGGFCATCGAGNGYFDQNEFLSFLQPSDNNLEQDPVANIYRPGNGEAFFDSLNRMFLLGQHDPLSDDPTSDDATPHDSTSKDVPSKCQNLPEFGGGIGAIDIKNIVECLPAKIEALTSFDNAPGPEIYVRCYLGGSVNVYFSSDAAYDAASEWLARNCYNLPTVGGKHQYPIRSYSQLLEPLVNGSRATVRKADLSAYTVHGVMSLVTNHIAFLTRQVFYAQSESLHTSYTLHVEEFQHTLKTGGSEASEPTPVCTSFDFMNDPFFFGATIPYGYFNDYRDQTRDVSGGLCSNACKASCQASGIWLPNLELDIPSGSSYENFLHTVYGESVIERNSATNAWQQISLGSPPKALLECIPESFSRASGICPNTNIAKFLYTSAQDTNGTVTFKSIPNIFGRRTGQTDPTQPITVNISSVKPRADDDSVIFYLEGTSEFQPCCTTVPLDADETDNLVAVHSRPIPGGQCYMETYTVNPEDIFSSFFPSVSDYMFIDMTWPYWTVDGSQGTSGTCTTGGTCTNKVHTDNGCCGHSSYAGLDCGSWHRCHDFDPVFTLPRINCGQCPQNGPLTESPHFQKECQIYATTGHQTGMKNPDQHDCAFAEDDPDCNQCGFIRISLEKTLETSGTSNIPDRIRHYLRCLDFPQCKTTNGDSDARCANGAPFGFLASQRSSIFSPLSSPPSAESPSIKVAPTTRCGTYDLFDQFAWPMDSLLLQQALAVQHRPWWSDLLPTDDGTSGTGSGGDGLPGESGAGEYQTAAEWAAPGNQLASAGNFPWLSGSICAANTDRGFYNKSTLALTYGSYGTQCTGHAILSTAPPTDFRGEFCVGGFAQSYLGAAFRLYFDTQPRFFEQFFSDVFACTAEQVSNFYTQDLVVPSTVCSVSSDPEILPLRFEGCSGFVFADDADDDATSSSPPVYYRTVGEFVGRKIFGLSGRGSLYPSPQPIEGGFLIQSFGFVDASSQGLSMFQPASSDLLHLVLGQHDVPSYTLEEPPPRPAASTTPPIFCPITNVGTDQHFDTGEFFVQNDASNGAYFPNAALQSGAKPLEYYTADADNGLVYTDNHNGTSFQTCVMYVYYPDDETVPDEPAVNTDDDDPVNLATRTLARFDVSAPSVLFYGLPFPIKTLFEDLDAEPLVRTPETNRFVTQLDSTDSACFKIDTTRTTRYVPGYAANNHVVGCFCTSSNCTDIFKMFSDTTAREASADPTFALEGGNQNLFYNLRELSNITGTGGPVSFETFSLKFINFTFYKIYQEVTNLQHPLGTALQRAMLFLFSNETVAEIVIDQEHNVAFVTISSWFLFPFNLTVIQSQGQDPVQYLMSDYIGIIDENNDEITVGNTNFGCTIESDSSTEFYKFIQSASTTSCNSVIADDTAFCYCKNNTGQVQDPVPQTPGFSCDSQCQDQQQTCVTSTSGADTHTTLTECFWATVDNAPAAWCPGICSGERVSLGIPQWASSSWCGPSPPPTNPSAGKVSLYKGPYKFGYGLSEPNQEIVNITSERYQSYSTAFDDLARRVQPTASNDFSSSLSSATVSTIKAWRNAGKIPCWFSQRGIVNDLDNSLFGVCAAEPDDENSNPACWWTAWPGTGRSALGCTDLFQNNDNWISLVLDSENDGVSSPFALFSTDNEGNVQLNRTADTVQVECKHRTRFPGVEQNVQQVACRWTYPETYNSTEQLLLPDNAPSSWFNPESNKPPHVLIAREGVKLQDRSDGGVPPPPPPCSSVAEKLCGNHPTIYAVQTIDSYEYKTVADVGSDMELSSFDCNEDLDKYKRLCSPLNCDVGVGTHVAFMCADDQPELPIRVCGDNTSFHMGMRYWYQNSTCSDDPNVYDCSHFHF